MKYFKHMADSSQDAFIEQLEELFGLKGYARWWKMIEAIAREMDKHPADPSATRTVSAWKTTLKAYHLKEIVEFLNFGVAKNKISVFFGSLTEGGKMQDTPLSIADLSSMSLRSSFNVIKISCPNILKLRDEYSRKSGYCPEQLRMDLAQELEKKERKNPYPLPLPHSEPSPIREKIPVPKLNGTHPEKKKDLNYDFKVAAAACCTLLARKELSDLDKTILLNWIERYDFKGFILPIIVETTEHYAKHNLGKRPGTLSYFSAKIREKAV